MSEKISTASRANAARRELLDLRKKLSAIDSDSSTDYDSLNVIDLAELYAQAEVDNDHTKASGILEAIDNKVNDQASVEGWGKSQINQAYEVIMNRAVEAGDSLDASADTLDDIVSKPEAIDTLDDIPSKPRVVDTLGKLASKPKAIDTLDDIAIGSKVDALDDASSDPTTVNTLDDIVSKSEVDTLDDVISRDNQKKSFGEVIRNSPYKAAAVLSVGVFRARQWLGKQHIKKGESQSHFERRRRNNTGQKIAVGALAVGAAVSLYLLNKHSGGSGGSSWHSDLFGNHNYDSPTPTESPQGTAGTEAHSGSATDAGASNGVSHEGDMPGVDDGRDVDPPGGESADHDYGYDDDADADSSGKSEASDMPGVGDNNDAGDNAGESAAAAVGTPMPELDSGNYAYPWDWSSDKFGSQNSREVLNKLVDQTDGAIWHRLGDGIDTNDWISVDGRSDTDYVIKRLSQVANENPGLVDSVYRG